MAVQKLGVFSLEVCDSFNYGVTDLKGVFREYYLVLPWLPDEPSGEAIQEKEVAAWVNGREHRRARDNNDFAY